MELRLPEVTPTVPPIGAPYLFFSVLFLNLRAPPFLYLYLFFDTLCMTSSWKTLVQLR
jgi:hypothetical protein